MVDLFEQMELARNEDKAKAMSAYMKNLFPFLGVQAIERRAICNGFFKEKKKRPVDWVFVQQCYEKWEREYQIIAIDYLLVVKDRLVESDIEKIKQLIITKSWWDSVDCINSIVGYLCLKYSSVKSEVRTWIYEENIWLKRIAIIHQLKYKEQTDEEFLSEAILKNNDSNEFFINKAIGWALRQYSKTNKTWVQQFLAQHELAKLSIREASKYL